MRKKEKLDSWYVVVWCWDDDREEYVPDTQDFDSEECALRFYHMRHNTPDFRHWDISHK